MNKEKEKQCKVCDREYTDASLKSPDTPINEDWGWFTSQANFEGYCSVECKHKGV